MAEFLLVSLVIIVTSLILQKEPGTDVVLLDNNSARNAIVVTTEGGNVTIDTPYEGTKLQSSAQAPAALEKVSKEALVSAEKDAFSVAPTKPLTVTLYFENDTARLTPQSRRELDDILPLLRELSPLRITITGYTDTTGSEAYNLALSEKRAAALKTLLESQHVAMRRCRTDGLGEYLLDVPTPDGTAEPKNRRAEMTIR